MWSYYGAKTNFVDLYPKPVHDTVIEPFAGSARYSLKHFERNIILVDKYPVVVSIWNWLKQCSEKDVLSIPRLKPGEKFADYNFDCEGAKLFCSFIHGCADNRPRNKPTARKTIDRPNHVPYNLNRIARQLYKIRHWDIRLGDYLDIQDQKATWFIDPPYQFGGHAYVMSSKKIDFSSLNKWCVSRTGQVIVCENSKANWMDFKTLSVNHGSLNKTMEVIWTNTPTIYDNEQLTLL